MSWECVAREIGVDKATVLRWRAHPEWQKAVADIDHPELDREAVRQAKAVLAAQLMHPDPKIQQGAAKAWLDTFCTKHVHVDKRTATVRISNYDCSGVDKDTLRLLLQETARANGVGPGRQPLAELDAAAMVDGEILEGEVISVG